MAQIAYFLSGTVYYNSPEDGSLKSGSFHKVIDIEKEDTDSIQEDFDFLVKSVKFDFMESEGVEDVNVIVSQFNVVCKP